MHTAPDNLGEVLDRQLLAVPGPAVLNLEDFFAKGKQSVRHASSVGELNVLRERFLNSALLSYVIGDGLAPEREGGVASHHPAEED